MALAICPTTTVIDNNYILYDCNALSHPSLDLFSYKALTERGLVTGWALGRGKTCIFVYNNQEWVLRHFFRGGIIAATLKDIYLGFNVKTTRSWKEWQLLCTLYTQNLPVPRPIAARATMGFCGYRADLITARIPGTTSLSDLLQQKSLLKEEWFSIGICLRKFHDFDVYHSDLNANNILLDRDGKIYLIDFDKCRLRSSHWWKNSNINRLHRSLIKFKDKRNPFFFKENDWYNLVRGYQSK